MATAIPTKCFSRGAVFQILVISTGSPALLEHQPDSLRPYIQEAWANISDALFRQPLNGHSVRCAGLSMAISVILKLDARVLTLTLTLPNAMIFSV